MTIRMNISFHALKRENSLGLFTVAANSAEMHFS